MSDLTVFVTSMMGHRAYLGKKKKHSGEFTTFLIREIEESIDDHIPEWFSRIATLCEIREDEVKQYVIEQCIKEHLKRCYKESMPKVPKVKK
jgi:hypothetical protein